MLTQSLLEAQENLQEFVSDPELEGKFEQAVDILITAFANGTMVLSCGNGGSCCDAMHFAEEFSGRYRKDRKALPAMAISDPSYMSCVANDYGYDFVFSRGVEAFGKKNGALLAISTSGNSKNVIEAAKKAREMKMQVIALSGKGGGELKNHCDVMFLAPGKNTDRIQEIHIKVIHTLIEGVERVLFPENYES